MKKLISVIVPVYNSEKYILDCVNSVLDQEFSSYEVIIVNDGSTDESLTILQSLAKQSDKIRVVSQENKGVSAARNLGLQLSQGDYIVFLDADDYLHKDALMTFMDVAHSCKADFVYSTKCFVTKNQKNIKKQVRRVVSSREAVSDLLDPKVIVGSWNKIYRKSFLVENNIKFNEKLMYGEGLNFIVDCSLRSEKTIMIEDRLYYYRRDNYNSATTSFSLDKIKNGDFALKLVEEKLIESLGASNVMFVYHRLLFRLVSKLRASQNKLLPEGKEIFLQWESVLREEYKFIMKSGGISPSRKVLLMIIYKAPKIALKIHYARQIYKRKRSVGEHEK